jgi:hypothetical protein
VLLALEPPESVVRNHDDRDAVAFGRPAEDRAVTDENTGQVCVDLEFDRTAIALTLGHRRSSSAARLRPFVGVFVRSKSRKRKVEAESGLGR